MTAPLLKWPGGKRRLVPVILQTFPNGLVNRLWEPFCGGAALYFACHSRLRIGGELSDVNSRLIYTYEAVKSDPGAVNDELSRLASNHSESNYYRTREKFNDGMSGAELAAAFIYLNRTGFNGL